MKHAIVLALLSLTFAAGQSVQAAGDIGYRFEKSTPVGSWQLREETTTDSKGKTSLITIKSSLVGKEQVDGEPHYWLEMESQAYKLDKKGARSKKGERMIMKILVATAALNGDYANTFKNLRSVGKKIVVQHGDGDPMLITGGGAMADAMLQAAGTDIQYDFAVVGNETVSVPAGSFKSRKVVGKGTTTMKVLFHEIVVQSESAVWISDAMPFGIVKATSSSTVNGKPEKADSTVVQFGSSGAVSQITKTPKVMEMPAMPDLFGGSKSK